MHDYHMLAINGVKQGCALAAEFRMGFDVLISSAFKYNAGIFMLCHRHHWLPPREMSLLKS